MRNRVNGLALCVGLLVIMGGGCSDKQGGGGAASGGSPGTSVGTGGAVACTSDCSASDPTTCTDTQTRHICQQAASGCWTWQNETCSACTAALDCINVRNVEWGGQSDTVEGVVAAPDGSVYTSEATLSGLGITANGLGSYDIYVVKWDGSGAPQWTAALGTSGQDFDRGLALGKNGKLYVVGRACATVSQCLAEVGCVSPAGKVEWTQTWGVDGIDLRAVSVSDATQAVYATGYTNAAFDDQTLIGGYDTYVTKWSLDGTKAWTKFYGTSADDFPTRTIVDDTGNLYVIGNTTGQLDTQTSQGGNDAFVLKLDPNGQLLWARQFGTAGDDYFNGIAVSGSTLYLAGGFSGDLDPNDAVNVAAGQYTPALIAITTDGSLIWTKQYTETASYRSCQVAIAPSGDIYMFVEANGDLPVKPAVATDGSSIYLTRWTTSGSYEWLTAWGTPSYTNPRVAAAGPNGLLAVAGGAQAAFAGYSPTYDLGGAYLSIVEIK